MRTSTVVYQLVAAMVIAQAGAAVQAPLFQPLLADPQEPQFFAGYLWARSPRLASRLGTVGFGQTIGVLSACRSRIVTVPWPRDCGCITRAPISATNT